jgi:hypothetical protein
VIRPAEVSDIPRLGELFHEVFGQPRESSVWRWKYFENPRGAASHICESEGRIVAHCGGTPVIISDGAARYGALQSTDFMSSRRHAGGLGGGGVFVRLVRDFFHAKCGPGRAEMVYGFPGERHRDLGERLLGYAPVEKVAELRLAGQGKERARETPLGPEHMGLFVSTPPFGAIRDDTYLNWRYLAHPTHRYGIVRSSSRLRASSETAAIVRRVERSLYLFEIGGSRSSRDVRRLISALPLSSGDEALFWCSAENPLARTLEEGGFRITERDHPVEVRFFRDRALPAPGELYFTLGDYDVY